MSEETAATPESPPAEPEDQADKSWVGRDVMVTMKGTITPWYDGVVTRVTECGGFVEVEYTWTGRRWFRAVQLTETEWHDCDDVYLIYK